MAHACRCADAWLKGRCTSTSLWVCVAIMSEILQRVRTSRMISGLLRGTLLEICCRVLAIEIVAVSSPFANHTTPINNRCSVGKSIKIVLHGVHEGNLTETERLQKAFQETKWKNKLSKLMTWAHKSLILLPVGVVCMFTMPVKTSWNVIPVSWFLHHTAIWKIRRFWEKPFTILFRMIKNAERRSWKNFCAARWPWLAWAKRGWVEGVLQKQGGAGP